MPTPLESLTRMVDFEMKSRNVGWIQNPSLDHPELSMRFET
jgi:hypothetical protein